MTVETLREPIAERPGTAVTARDGALPADPTASDPAPLALTVAFRHVGSVCLLTLQGALVAETLRVFESQIDRLGRTTCRRVVIDAAGLTTMDDAGLRVLTGLHHYVRARGGRLSVTGASGSVVRALASTPLLAG